MIIENNHRGGEWDHFNEIISLISGVLAEVVVVVIVPPAISKRDYVCAMKSTVSTFAKFVFHSTNAVEITTHALRVTCIRRWGFHFYIIPPPVAFKIDQCA